MLHCSGLKAEGFTDYGAVLVSKLKSHFIVLIFHFMQHQLHFHALLRIDSENSFYEGTMG